MAIDIPLELDSGPITWVKAEIDSALLRALEGIERLRREQNTAVANSVRSELHRVSGAFELVGVEGLAVLVQEFERHFTEDLSSVSPEALDLVDRGCRRLLSHLKEMASGSAPVPLRFISEYLALGKLRRSKFGPADLFFPDLSRRPSRLSDVEPPEPSRMPAFLLRQRRDFQQGLLQWLRGNDGGLEQMRRAVAEIEMAYPLPSQRSFWWATHALLEAASGEFVESSTALKQLMARVDLQVRRFVEGSTRVADRLRREVLYHVARAKNGHALVDEVKALYELDVLVPKRVPREIDVVALQPAIDGLAALVTRCKDAWTSANSGRTNALARLTEAANELPAACDALKIVEFSSLGKAIADAATTVSKGQNISDDLSIEFATSLILLETALEHIAALPGSFRAQVQRAVQRLSYAINNMPIPVELRAESESNSLTRRAQERQTVTHVAREIRANMRLVEQALDTVFRDRNAIDELKPLPGLLAQVSGAMHMLGWNEANELLTQTTGRLIDSLQRDGSLSTTDIDSLADVLAGLSFYVDVRERRDRDAEELLVGLKRRLTGERAPASTADDESVEASLAERQRQLRPLAKAIVEQPDRPELRDSLRLALQGVRQDAELLSDPALSEASSAALRLLDSGSTPAADLSAALGVITGSPVLMPPTSAETSRLLESEQVDRDTGLLDIFVEEATEVVTNMRSQYAELVTHPDARDVLVDVRRAFHTLKGSGRMVGQTTLSEAAWRIERVLNATIEAERPISDPELKLISKAADTFDLWVQQLRDTHSATVDPETFDELIERCGARIPNARAGTSTTSIMPLARPLSPLADHRSYAADGLPAPAIIPPEFVTEQENLLPGDLLPVLEIEPLDSMDRFDDEVTVLGVTVSRALFSILTDESRVHLQTLENELSLLQFDPSLPPSDAMVRASHTLCGIHKTAGFTEVGEFAGLLESTLIAVRRNGRNASHLSAFSVAIQGLRTATLRLQAHSIKSAEEQADFDLARLQLESILRETGASADGVEVELIEQTHAEERALAASEVVAAPPIVADIKLADLSVSGFMAESPPLSGQHVPVVAGVENAYNLISPVPSVETPAPVALVPISVVPVQVVASPVVPPLVVRNVVARLAPIASAPATDNRFVPAPSADPLIDVNDDIDDQVLPIFLEEAQELYPRAGEQLTAWRNDPKSSVQVDGLKRTLHTLKGSARMAGAMRLGELAHGFETQILEAPTEPGNALFDRLDEHLDDIAYLLERLTHGEKNAVLPRFAAPVSQPVELDVLSSESPDTPLDRDPATAGENDASSQQTTPARASVVDIAQRLALRSPAAVPQSATVSIPDSSIATAFLRVRSEAVEQLADEAGEISINRSRIESEVRNLKTGLLDLTSSVVRLRGQLREIEIQGESQIQSRLDQESKFDPLEFDRYTRFQELTRGLAEGVNDVATVQQSLLKNLADAETALSIQTRLSRSVQLRLQTLRTVPFSNVSDRLYRVLRQTAKELKRRANLDIRGGRIEIDRSVLERLTPVLEHLIRNALAHGIEDGVERESVGKSETGELSLTVRQQGNEVAISLSDDGGGIPLARIRQRAITLNMLGTDDAPSDAQLLEYIFQPGFSTAEQVTAVAGRGIGMDVVRNEVAALGGRVEVQTSAGIGTTFTLSVPLTLAVTQVLLVAVGKSTFGIPSSIIDQVRQVPVKERNAAHASAAGLEHQGQRLAFRSLAELTRVATDPAPQRSYPVIILKAGDTMAAVEVDRIISNQEVVAKPYGPQLARVPGLAGLTVLANGTIALLLNPLNLILASAEPSHARAPAVASVEPLSIMPELPTATLVEESPVVGHIAALEIISPPVASVHVSLPVQTTTVDLPPVIVARPPALAPLIEPRIPVVLVVDDSLTVRKITSRLLEREGYIALTAKDGLDALQVLSDNDPDVILLDIEMPRMDGFEFTKTIKADNRQSNIPIIMITSRTAEKHRSHAFELGVNDYVGKPYQDEHLLALVAKHVEARKTRK